MFLMQNADDSLLESSLSLENRSLWFGNIQLYPDEVVISGWSWTGPVEERIPIDEIEMVEKWTVTEGLNFRLRSMNGRAPVFGRIEEGAKFWEVTFDQDDRIELKKRH
ncbi:MAG: hypothetical protein ABEK84_07650 [Salinibacter sp.]